MAEPDTPVDIVQQQKPLPNGSAELVRSESVSSITSDPVHDLPGKLLDLGWRRFWSEREGREYYYNKVTGESLWELPGVVPHTPTGDIVPNLVLTAPTSTTTTPSIHPARIGIKRTSSESSSSSSQVSKKALVSFWDLDITTNCILSRLRTHTFYPVHPDVEVQRALCMDRLRLQLQNMCHNRLTIDAPKESFNRWLLERHVTDTGSDLLLPSLCKTELSESLFREIINDLPIRLQWCTDKHSSQIQLVKYSETAMKLVEKISAVGESRDFIEFQAEDVIQWLRKSPHATKQEYEKRLRWMREKCKPHLTNIVKNIIENLATKLHRLSAEHALRLKEKNVELFADVISAAPVPPEPRSGKIFCTPATTSVPPVLLPPVEMAQDDTCTMLTYKNYTVKVKTNFFYKLETLYKYNCHNDPRWEYFLPRVWCMLRRYESFFCAHDGMGLQGALPVPVFQAMNRLFDVTFELFASPLNCYFRQYCSAFTDTDGYFGSRGRMLDFKPVGGSFEANPPFCEELNETMVNHMEDLLAASNEPLSFIVFTPEWRDPTPGSLSKMETSRFKRCQFLIDQYEHDYRHGFQHICPDNDLLIKSAHGTQVIFLQNEPGLKKWTPTEEKVNKLKEIYKTSRKHSQADDTNSSSSSAL